MKNLLILMLSFLFISCYTKPPDRVIYKSDTTYIFNRDTFQIQAAPEVIILRDTIIQIKPFTAKIDTIIKRIYLNKIKYDTVKAAFTLEDANNMLLSLKVNNEADSIPIISKTEEKIYTEKPLLWYHYFALFLAICVLIIIIRHTGI